MAEKYSMDHRGEGASRRRFIGRGLARIGAALLAPTLLAGCGGSGSGTSDPTVTSVSESGSVRQESFEGGFYALIGDSGVKYDPQSLPADFQQDGLRVKFQGDVLNNVASPHLFGLVLSVTKIEKV